jgi:hypothetical protein
MGRIGWGGSGVDVSLYDSSVGGGWRNFEARHQGPGLGKASWPFLSAYQNANYDTWVPAGNHRAYTHRWSEGDVLVWDTSARCIMQKRIIGPMNRV